MSELLTEIEEEAEALENDDSDSPQETSAYTADVLRRALAHIRALEAERAGMWRLRVHVARDETSGTVVHTTNANLKYHERFKCWYGDKSGSQWVGDDSLLGAFLAGDLLDSPHGKRVVDVCVVPVKETGGERL